VAKHAHASREHGTHTVHLSRIVTDRAQALPSSNKSAASCSQYRLLGRMRSDLCASSIPAEVGTANLKRTLAVAKHAHASREHGTHRESPVIKRVTSKNPQ